MIEKRFRFSHYLLYINIGISRLWRRLRDKSLYPAFHFSFIDEDGLPF